MSATLYTFEEQINRKQLVATGNVQYEDEVAGDPLAALEARRFFLIAAPGITGGSDSQGAELNDWMANDINVNGLGIVDMQVHEVGGRSRITVVVEDPAIVGPPATISLQYLRVRNWEQIAIQSGGTTPFLSVEESHLPVAQRTNIDDYLALLTQRSVLLPDVADAMPADPGAGNQPNRAFLWHRIHSCNGMTRIVTCEVTVGHGGLADPVTPLP